MDKHVSSRLEGKVFPDYATTASNNMFTVFQNVFIKIPRYFPREARKNVRRLSVRSSTTFQYLTCNISHGPCYLAYLL